MELLELSPAFSLSVDPEKVVSVVALPSQKLLFGKIPPKIIITMENGKEYNLSVTQEDVNVDLLYKEIVNRINEAREDYVSHVKSEEKE